MAAAQDQLLGLDVEFHLADAAAAQLQVGALGAQPLVHLVGVDLALDRMDVGDGGEIEVAAPDEGLQLLQERPPARGVAAHRPGLDEGRPLPVLADAFVVVEGRVHRHGQGRGRGIGAQAQVQAEHIAVGRAALQDVRQPLGDLGHEGLWLDAGRQGQGVRLVEDRDVDIAGIVQLERAVLAHGDAEVARQRALVALAQPGDPPRRQGLARGQFDGGLDRHVGEAGEGAGDRVQVPGAAEVGQGGEQVEGALELA